MSDVPTKPVVGIAWMLATGMCFVTVTALVKFMGNAVPAAQAAFLRYLLGLVFLIPMWPSLRRTSLTPRLLALFSLRGIVHALAVIAWFFAMTRIPIAEVTAMNYLSPVYVALGAALFLGERLALRRILAIAVALVGAFVILRPGFREVNAGHMAMLGTAVLFAVSYLVGKVTADEVPAAAVVGMLSITVTIGLAPFALAVWVTPELWVVATLLVVALFATLGHYTMTRAFAAAPLTVTQPVTFLQLVWAVLLGALVFSEPVDIWVITGGSVIMASVLFLTLREAQIKKRGITPAVHAPKI